MNDTGDTTMTKPITINPSVAATAIPVLLRQLIILIGGFVTLASFLPARDMAGLWRWAQTEDFAAWVSMLAMFGAIGWGQARSLLSIKQLTTIGRQVPDDVAVVREPTPPPAVDEAL